MTALRFLPSALARYTSALLWAVMLLSLACGGCAWPLEGAPCPCAEQAGYECCGDNLCHLHGCEGIASIRDPSHEPSDLQPDAAAAIDADAGHAKPLPEGASPSMLDFVPMFDARDMVH